VAESQESIILYATVHPARNWDIETSSDFVEENAYFGFLAPRVFGTSSSCFLAEVLFSPPVTGNREFEKGAEM
jgi:hypothetical protein